MLLTVSTLATFLSPACPLPVPPQDPPAARSATAPKFAEAVRSLDQGELLQELERDVRAYRRGRIRAFRSPGLVRTLRDAGHEVLDVASTTVSAEGGVEGVVGNPLAVFDAARAMWGIDGAWRRVPRRIDLRGFEDLLEEAMRDVRSALGSGRETDRMASALISSVETLRQRRREALLNGELADPFDDDAMRAIERLAAVDQRELLRIARWVTAAALELTRPESVAAFRRQPTEKSSFVLNVVDGDVVFETLSSFGRIVVGGPGKNRYDCNQVDVIIDLGGDDEYQGRAGGAGELRSLALVLDLSGNDTYTCLNDGLGSGTFGLGVLIDVEGDDRYESLKRSAGFGAGGVGVFMDLAGDDTFDLGQQAGGVGIAGTGIFVDLRGDDVHQAATGAFGCGLPGGLGLFVDAEGDDRHVLGQEVVVEQVEDQGVTLGAGAGFGILPLLEGGLGVFCDLAGADSYEIRGGLALGAGARGGAGVFWDREGDDSYRAGLFSYGSAFDQGIGVFVDGAGSDKAAGGAWCMGAANDTALGAYLDRAGDDVRIASDPALGVGRSEGLALYADLAGRDQLTVGTGPLRIVFGVQATSRGPGMGMYLHEGSAEDRYAGITAGPKPVDGESLAPATGEGDARAVRLQVDR